MFWNSAKIRHGSFEMGRISKDIELTGFLKSKPVEAMFDTGANNNFLPAFFRDGSSVEEIGYKEYFGKREFFMANHTNTMGDVVKFDKIIIDGLKIKDPIFVILETLVEDAIIGTQLMQDYSAILRLGEDTVTFR